MKVQIRHRFTGSVLFEAEAVSVSVAVVAAVASGANLRGADLRGAYLRDYGSELALILKPLVHVEEVSRA